MSKPAEVLQSHNLYSNNMSKLAEALQIHNLYSNNMSKPAEVLQSHNLYSNNMSKPAEALQSHNPYSLTRLNLLKQCRVTIYIQLRFYSYWSTRKSQSIFNDGYIPAEALQS